MRAARISSRSLRTAPATVILSLFILACSTSSASAATCADFSNQADAQRAANTLDGDGDGVYCEALPCPCARPGSSSPAPSPTASPRRRETIRARITAVIDGDTIRVLTASRRRVTVRLIGIDTPETRKPGTPVECGGPEASANLRRLSFSGSLGRGVSLTSDPSQDRVDRFGRLLAYATTDARRDLALEQLRAGHSAVYVFRRSFARLAAYRSAEGQARAAGRGAWATCGGDFHRPASAASGSRRLEPIAARASQASPERVYFSDRRNRSAYKPRNVYFGLRSTILGLRWRGWGGSSTTGRGRLEYNACRPSCAQSQPSYYAVRVTLSRARVCNGRRQYRTMSFRYTGSRPSGRGRSYRESFGFVCD